MKINFYEFFKTRGFLFFRKMELSGVYFSSSKKMEIFEDLCLPYSDAALSYVTGYR